MCSLCLPEGWVRSIADLSHMPAQVLCNAVDRSLSWLEGHLPVEAAREKFPLVNTGIELADTYGRPLVVKVDSGLDGAVDRGSKLLEVNWCLVHGQSWGICSPFSAELRSFLFNYASLYMNSGRSRREFPKIPSEFPYCHQHM